MFNFSTETNTKWSFMTILLVVALAVVLGLFISNSELLQPKIAAATAERMNIANDIEYQKAQLELQALQRQAEMEKATQAQNLATKIANDQLALELRKSANDALALGMNLGVVALLAVLTVWGASLGVAFARPQRKSQVVNNAVAGVRKIIHSPSAAARLARENERLQNEIRLLLKAQSKQDALPGTHVIWPEQTEKSNKPGGSFPLAG